MSSTRRKRRSSSDSERPQELKRLKLLDEQRPTPRGFYSEYHAPILDHSLQQHSVVDSTITKRKVAPLWFPTTPSDTLSPPSPTSSSTSCQHFLKLDSPPNSAVEYYDPNFGEKISDRFKLDDKIHDPRANTGTEGAERRRVWWEERMRQIIEADSSSAGSAASSCDLQDYDGGMAIREVQLESCTSVARLRAPLRRPAGRYGRGTEGGRAGSASSGREGQDTLHMQPSECTRSKTLARRSHALPPSSRTRAQTRNCFVGNSHCKRRLNARTTGSEWRSGRPHGKYSTRTLG